MVGATKGFIRKPFIIQGIKLGMIGSIISLIGLGAVIYYINKYIPALQLLNELHIKVPEDIALVGFGNEPFTAMVTPTITSINQHSAEIGKQAALTFLEHAKKEVINQSLNKIILDAELIVRDSSNFKV